MQKVSRCSFSHTRHSAIIVEHISQHVIFQLAFHLQWMQFSQHSEAIEFYHGHSNPIGRALEIPHISIYNSALHPYDPTPACIRERTYREFHRAYKSVHLRSQRKEKIGRKVNRSLSHCMNVIKLPWAVYDWFNVQIKERISPSLLSNKKIQLLYSLDYDGRKSHS